MASIVGDGEETKKRIFINYLDSYGGNNIGKYLSQCVPGAALDEIEEEEEEQEEEQEFSKNPTDGCYEIYGTLKDITQPKPDYAKEIINSDTRTQFYELLSECDIIVYNIAEDPDQIDEAVWAISELHSDLERLEKPKTFILLSTVMTWAKSKPLDPDDPEIPFTEDDYRRRKPHPNFKDHVSAEKTVIKIGKTNKSKLSTYVVASGLTYGCGENIFHYMFKAAWHNAPALQCFGPGKNIIPAIHIKDLAGVVQNIADSRPKVRYMIAVDGAISPLEDIVKAVSTSLSTGKIKHITKEDALLSKDIEQADYDMLLVDLRMDATYVKENMHIKWVSDSGIIESMEKLVKEFKDVRALQPMRAYIHGPPAVGKTTIAKMLCDHYKLHHITQKEVIDEAMERLTRSAARIDQQSAEESEEGEEEDDGQAQADQETLDAIAESKENNGGRIEDSFIIQFYRDKLKSMPCQNQGFILDGYPETLEQAKELFAIGEEEEAEESEKSSFDKTTMPEFVFTMEADDDFLRNRVMNLPESVVAGTDNTEEGFQRRMAEFKAVNAEDETVLNYFDELEFHPERFDIMKDNSQMMKDTFQKMKKIMGSARNYGPTPEELEKTRRDEEEKRLKKEADERNEQIRQEEAEATERKRRQEEWTAQLDEVKKEEFDMLEAQSVPLRNFLMKQVMPTLTQGLIECCKIRPDDPIDYLAEYLFKNNPDIE